MNKNLVLGILGGIIGIGVLAAGVMTLKTSAKTEAPRLEEPGRSDWYIGCVLSGGLPVTLCQCIETALITKAGGASEEALIKLGEAAAKQAIKQCTEGPLAKEVLKEIEEAMTVPDEVI